MKRILWCLAALAGCAVDPGEPLDIHVEGGDPGLPPIEFSSQGAYALWSNGGTATMDLGPIAGRTCFLSGIAGSLAFLVEGQQIAIEQNGTDYQLRIQTEVPVKVWARCVNGPGTPEVQFHIDQTVVAPMQAGRRCFLTGLSMALYRKGQVVGFDSSADWVAITHDDTNWLLGASDDLDLTFWANARCVDGTTTEGTWFAQAPDPGTATVDLPDVSGETCGLTELRGYFESTDLTDGAFVTRDDTTNVLQLTATNGKRGEVGCVK